MPNITGLVAQFYDIGSVVSGYTSGAFQKGKAFGRIQAVGATGGSSYELLLDASRSSSTYQDNAPVQPNSVSTLLLIKY